MKNNYNYIIIDDEPKAIKVLQNTISQLYSDLKMIGSYTDWESALTALSNRDLDIAFLDISMPHKTGFGILDMLPELTCEVIFVTAHEEFALHAFKYSPVDYLLKPVKSTRLEAAIAKATAHIQHKPSTNTRIYSEDISIDDKIVIRNKNGLDYVKLRDIIFFEASNRYTHIITANKNYVSTTNLGKFKEVLKEKHFFNVHRSYLVNIDHIKRYESSGILTLTNGHQIPVAKSTREDFLTLFEKF